MATKRCEICHKAKQIDEKDLCCSDCESREMDLLMAAYAFIHCFDADYCPVRELIATVPAVNGVKLSQTFIRSWLLKNWLDKNELNSIRVPPPLYEELQDSGFSVSDVVRKKLVKQKEKKVQFDNVAERAPEPKEDVQRVGMVFMERKKGD